MLAAWFRLKYPHVVIGSVASSAPILQFDGLVSPYTFIDIVTNDFKVGDHNWMHCSSSPFNYLNHMAR